jgi:ribonuclease-3
MKKNILPPIKFNNSKLLLTALTHRSSLNEQTGAKSSYERLEFLGDAVLELVVSNYLFLHYPKHPEGALTHLRANLVQTKTLAAAALKLKLDQYIILSKGEHRSGGDHNPSLLADCFEAVVGAVYLDQGIEVAKKFIDTHLLKEHRQLIASAKITDYKSLLQEAWQKDHQLTPSYRLISAIGPDHSKNFTVRVFLKNKRMGEGSGKSKQEAQQQAAKAALEKNK